MSAKQNKHSQKEIWQTIRARYTWHLRPPFDKEFDGGHWWRGEGKREITPDAALYELVRRHPLVGKGLIKRAEIYTATWGDASKCLSSVVNGTRFELIRDVIDGLREPHSLYCTCRIGLKSWVNLSEDDHESWVSNIGNLKGLDSRDVDLQCHSINEYAHNQIIQGRKADLKKKGKIKELDYEQSHENRETVRQRNLSALRGDLATNPPAADEWEVAIANQAVEAHRDGYLLLAVAPDLKPDKVASIMKKVYAPSQIRYGRPNQKARWENWLPLISEFENDEAEPKKKAKSQVFARYRRALDGVQFI